MTPPSSAEYLKGESDIVLAYDDMHAAINLLSLMYSEKKASCKNEKLPISHLMMAMHAFFTCINSLFMCQDEEENEDETQSFGSLWN